MFWMMRRLLLGAVGLPVALLLLYLAYIGSHHAGHSHYADHLSPASVEAASSPIYFSPSTNLEEVDIVLIERARRSIDVAVYTFIRDYTEKGSKLYVEGKLSTRSWEDKDSGKTLHRTEIVATDIGLQSSKNGGSQGNGGDRNGSQEKSGARGKPLAGWLRLQPG